MRSRLVLLLVIILLVALAGLPAGSASTGRPGITGAHTNKVSWLVAPGVYYREYDATSVDGPQRVHIVDLDPSVPGVGLDYVAGHHLRDRAATSELLAKVRAVAGVNGNFFDIGDTAAPLGIGFSSKRGLLHAPAFGWNNAFYQLPDGSYHIGILPLVAQIEQYPDWSVTGLNTPNAKPNSITVYTPAWGDIAGSRVVNPPVRAVREVHIRQGIVRQNSPTLRGDTTIKGELLVGLGVGADELATIPVGTQLTTTWHLDPTPRMAITGSQVLVQDGRVVAQDDHQLAPRTAVGIDQDTGHVLLVAIDGRLPFAKGRSTLGFAKLLRGLGIEDAINLDGGGSTTMVARNPELTATGVVNSPSRGVERLVADALAVRYQKPYRPVGSGR